MLQNLPYFGFSDIDFIRKKIDNVARNYKRKKTIRVFVFQNIANFIKPKLLISEARAIGHVLHKDYTKTCSELEMEK